MKISPILAALGANLFLSFDKVNAEFGDFADHSFQCPARIQCAPVCVSNLTACPQELTCANPFEILCDNGRACVTDINDCPEDDNPCAENPCGNSVACLRAALFEQDCAQYDEIVDDATTCEENEGNDDGVEGPEISWSSPGHKFFYSWISIVTVLVLGWCAFNQRVYPVGETVPLDDFTSKETQNAYANLDGANSHASWTQTGYKQTIIGDFIYFLTLCTLFGFHALLASLVGFYYAQQDLNGPGLFAPYQNEKQVLLAFEITWLVGCVWTLSLRWPSSIRALFLRRCVLSEATHVAVFAPKSHMVKENKNAAAQAQYIQTIKNMTMVFFKYLDSFYAFLFSDVDRPSVPGRYHFQPVDTERSFRFHLRRYNFDPDTQMFVPGILSVGSTVGDMLKHDGLTDDEVTERRMIVGDNVIPMKKPTFIGTLVTEAGKVFYIYQIFIIWWWCNFWYHHVGILYVGMFGLGCFTTAYITYLNDAKLYQLGIITGTAKVWRNGQNVTIPQKELVPGDVVAVEAGITYCDMVLLEEGTVLVDESAITGEATPVAKTGFDSATRSVLYSTKGHKKNTIQAGAIILVSEEGSHEAKALVTHTGSFTTKGNLLRDILYYERHQFKFDLEIKLVFAILVLYGIFGFSITVHFLNEDPVYAIFYGMFVVETAIPPLIPTVFLVAVGISADRLRRRRIACADNRDILVTGKVSMAFFDKTGTLTHQGLDFMSSRAFVEGQEASSSEDGSSLKCGMAVCHTLTKAGSDYLGTPVDAVMFKATKAEISSSDSKAGPIVVTTEDGSKLRILKRFEFDHRTMTQSVIVQDEAGRTYSYVKGSAESISKLCNKESLPSNFAEMAEDSSREGIYQIAMATGKVELNKENDTAFVKRDHVETDLTFIGFVNFRNTLREETSDTLKQLRDGGVTCSIVSGDSIFSVLKTAYECELLSKDTRIILGRLVDSTNGSIQWVDAMTDASQTLPSLAELADPSQSLFLAVTGDVWQHLQKNMPEQVVALAPFIKLYGRCNPDDKVSVVAHFVKQGFVTLMCGDGTNDCGALRTAHVGVALSDSEASIVAAFTSLDKTPGSVVEVLKEGRCCLASAFSSYKFMLMYGQLESMLQIVAAYFAVTFYEWNWVWLDAVLVVPLAFSLPLSTAAKSLSPTRPTASILGPHTLASAVGVLFINLSFLFVGVGLLHKQDWYLCRKWSTDDISNVLALGDNYESETLYLITSTQYIISAMAFNFGFTFRKNYLKNYWFVALSTGLLFIQYYITLVPGELSCLFRVNCDNEDNPFRSVYSNVPVAIQNPLNTTLMPEEFRHILVILMTVNMVIVLAWEYFIVGLGWGKRIFVGKSAEPMSPPYKYSEVKKPEETSEEKQGIGASSEFSDEKV